MAVEKPARCVELGAMGFTHAAWAGAFYPPDLPEEWRLDFYANELQAVLLPQSEWLAPPAEVFAEWVGDAARMRVYCLAEPNTLASEAAAQRADALGAGFAGWVLQGVSAPGSAVHPRVAHAPVLGPCGPPAWPDPPPGLAIDAAGELALWQPPAGHAMPAMRQVIDDLQAHGGLPRRLFITGDPAPEPVFLRDGRLLLELMGIAPRCDDRDTASPKGPRGRG